MSKCEVHRAWCLAPGLLILAVWSLAHLGPAAGWCRLFPSSQPCTELVAHSVLQHCEGRPGTPCCAWALSGGGAPDTRSSAYRAPWFHRQAMSGPHSPALGPPAHLYICAGSGAEQEAAALQALAAPQQQQQQEGAKAALCRWQKLAEGEGLELVHPHSVSQVTWHARGDYFASVAPAGNTQVGGVPNNLQHRVCRWDIWYHFHKYCDMA